MSESKIGKWLTRGGRTAVVFADHGETLFGVYWNDIRWILYDWFKTGMVYGDQECTYDLIRRVSDSTDLTPYVPVKRVRPWTRAEVEAIVQQRPLWVTRDGGVSMMVVNTYELGFDAGDRFWSFDLATRDLVQIDGSPCGVEVEE